MVWFGVALGGVVGGKESNTTGTDNGGGVAKNWNSDSESKDGGQGIFTIYDHPVWIYFGGLIGFGDNFGIYFTAGPMIGRQADLAVGAGLHAFKCVGAGLVIPVFRTIRGASRHSDKVAYVADQAQYYAAQAAEAFSALTQSGYAALEQIVSDPIAASASCLAAGMVVAEKSESISNAFEGARTAISKMKSNIMDKLYQ